VAHRLVRLGLLCLAGLAGAPAGAYEGDVIDLFVEPTPAVFGASVRIYGGAAFTAETRTVDIRLDSPSGKVYQRDTEAQPDGTYTYTFGPLDEAGEWRVRAAGPPVPGFDDREVADERFQVLAAGAAVTVAAQELAGTATDMQVAVQGFQDAAVRYPDTPGVDQALEGATEATAALADMQARLAEVNADCAAIAESADTLAIACPNVQAALAEGAQVAAQATAELAPARRQLLDRVEETSRAADWCYLWCLQGECLKQTLGFIKPLKSAVSGLANWAYGKMRTTAEKDMRDLALRAGTGELWGNITREQYAQCKQAQKDLEQATRHLNNAATGFSDLTTPLVLALNKCTDWVVGSATGNCEWYRGPVKGRLHVDYYAKGQVYMQARYDIEGTAELFFEKRRGEDDVVRLRGNIHGHGKQFVGAMDLRHIVEGIPGQDYVAFCLPRWRPSPFHISIEGKAEPDRLLLQFQTPATTDFNPKEYRYVQVLFGAFMMTPTVDFHTVPVPGAEWFLTRVTGTAGDQKEFEVPLQAEGDSTVAHRAFERIMDYVETDEFRSTLALDFRACSPACDD